ncbi:hypothetical protein AK812_SmicGene8312 [Symbiodinium microadriaticum]|uniref:Uncharacterized protein n=1 Tax=Symbiodinium microadriaticum TaxID=2951 RepID=A0A1Q9EL91_SYMMI|nr:hypothetical protein AK812_SmicGene8312 [Symbiodinium microadriaticum]
MRTRKSMLKGRFERLFDDDAMKAHGPARAVDVFGLQRHQMKYPGLRYEHKINAILGACQSLVASNDASEADHVKPLCEVFKAFSTFDMFGRQWKDLPISLNYLRKPLQEPLFRTPAGERLAVAKTAEGLEEILERQLRGAFGQSPAPLGSLYCFQWMPRSTPGKSRGLSSASQLEFRQDKEQSEHVRASLAGPGALGIVRSVLRLCAIFGKQLTVVRVPALWYIFLGLVRGRKFWAADEDDEDDDDNVGVDVLAQSLLPSIKDSMRELRKML